MMKPLVSVIIPSFNRYEFLKNAIDSVKNQTYENLEIIVINDCSTDERYYDKNNFENVLLINLEQNQKEKYGFGPGAVRNFGIDNAKGKYIAFLDDDDIWFEEKLDLQINKLETTDHKMSSTEALIGYGIFDPNKQYKKFLSEFYIKKIEKKNTRNPFKYIFRDFVFPEIWDRDFVTRHWPVITSSVVIEKDVLSQIGGFRNLPKAADFDCWIAALQYTDLIYFDEPLVYYDQNHGYGRNYNK